MGFSFERLTAAFEQIHAEHVALAHAPPAAPSASSRPLPSTPRFLAAMSELVSLFETLGSAFTFVKRDIERKLAILGRHAQASPAHYSDLNDAVQHEVRGRTLRAKWTVGDPSAARTLLRLMWALKFADCLLDGLAEREGTLRWAVGRAYEEALAEHHSWGVRRTVRGACLLLPTKEVFMARVGGLEGGDREQEEEVLRKLGGLMSPLVKRMYAYYEKHELLDLP